MLNRHGGASWSSADELAQAGLRQLDNPHGLWLGYTADTSEPLTFCGEEHVLTVAPPGSGKTACGVLPNLVMWRGSAVVTDPKGALTAQTAARRRELGQRVVVLNPWRDELAKPGSLGLDLGDDGFNPLALLKADDPALYENAGMIGNLLSPTPPDAENEYWSKAARRCLKGGMLLLTLSPDRECTLPTLYELFQTTPEGMRQLAADMIALGLENEAADILAPLASDKQWAGVHGKIQDALEIYSPRSALGRHVARDGFNPSDLKGEQALTVYVVIPSNRRDENKAWLALVMALCAEAVGRPGPSKPVLLLAEEFANLGFMPSIARAMAEYREAGLRCWLVVQSLHQLMRIYGKDGAQEIVNLCSIKQFFRVDDLEIARQIEAMAGTYTAHQVNTSGGRSSNGEGKPGGSNLGWSQNETGFPLIRAQDILALPRDAQIILWGGMRPILATLTPYWNVQFLRNHIAPNPYRPDVPPLSDDWRATAMLTAAPIPRKYKVGFAAALVCVFLLPFMLNSPPRWIKAAVGMEITYGDLTKQERDALFSERFKRKQPCRELKSGQEECYIKLKDQTFTLEGVPGRWSVN